MRRVDGQRGQYREDAVLEELRHRLALAGVQLVPAEDVDALLDQRGQDLLAPGLGLPVHQFAAAVQAPVEHLTRQQSTGRPDRDARRDPPLQPGDPDHEELVQVAREDGEELGSLEQRDPLVLGQLEHPLVEREPAQLAVREPVLREIAGLRDVVRGLDVVLPVVRRQQVSSHVVQHPIPR